VDTAARVISVDRKVVEIDRLLDLRIWHLLDADVLGAVP
jgi:hypothetical protein